MWILQFSRTQSDKSGYKNCLQIGHWNLNGLILKQFGNKLELREVFDKVGNFDVFGVSETHLLPNNGKQLDSFQYFHSYRKPGKRRNYGSGGISGYIKNGILKGTSVTHGESPDFMWVCLKKKNLSFIQRKIFLLDSYIYHLLGRAKRIWYLSPMRAAKVRASLAHPRSLARTSAARSYKHWVKRNLQTESQIPSPSEWLGMRS